MDTTTTIAFQNNTLDFSKAVWHQALQHNYPVALWRLPHTGTIHLMVDFSGTATTTPIDLEELPAGFAFSPFLNDNGQASLFIRGDMYYTITDGAITEETLKANIFNASRYDRFRQQVADELTDPESKQTSDIKYTETPLENVAKSTFEGAVSKAIEAINQGHFRKVVLSRTKEITLLSNPDNVQNFLSLCSRYPHAFVSLVFIPDVGIWMGASPETLISVDKQGIFRTVSLAGTQRLVEGLPVSQAVWTQKEIEEQALVSRYIVNCFKKIRLREYEEIGPRTVAAGNLMHLQTEFTVDTQEVNFPQLGTVMLQLLHPTSAVCGTPKEPALQFILDFEKHDRSFYSGFLGPVNVNAETHLFVNLRCMQLSPDKAILYAGAGITADSDPQKEWIETELKCRTLLDVFKQ
ncbi:chorismate-binding protein [Rhodocytophaga aerolata]|uniref:isochorismate synthase n=1 Tax=Rhodocytophaga aerolata TaxID=455078 RepID=A0ABT8R790_9BACT|nr:chorismate-binding protein [Rhodocytophaga aerolata]MDO1447976.1 chorismate-binding protein [Rhodocytophaga aerolata]